MRNHRARCRRWGAGELRPPPLTVESLCLKIDVKDAALPALEERLGGLSARPLALAQLALPRAAALLIAAV